MTTGLRALLAVLAIFLGWGMMVAAYDRPQWIFQLLALAGIVLVLVAAIWWGVAERRAREADAPAPRRKKND